MEDWRERLHQPSSPEDLQQPNFTQALDTACNVLTPSLTRESASSACALLIGPPSSGKSLFTRLLIDKLQETTSQNLVVVSLSGLLHSKPARAWHHLAHSLINWFEESHQTTSAPSNPVSSGNSNDVDADNTDDIDRYQCAIQPALQHLKDTGTALLLVLDQLHRFASSDPLAQTVLYSLFNLLQDRSLKAACVAHTSYIDVTDLLEKRVLSRLSHRKIIIPLVESSAEVLDFISTALAPLIKNSSPPLSRGRGRSRGKRRGSGTGRNTTPAPIAISHVVTHLLQQGDFAAIVDHHLARTRLISPILRAVDAALTMTNEADDQETALLATDRARATIQDALMSGDSTLDTITSLTQLQLSLLVALRRVEGLKLTAARKDSGGIGSADKNMRIVFRDVFIEYGKLGHMDGGRMAERDLAQTVVERSVAERAWELLIESGIVVRTGAGPRDSRPVFCAVAAAHVDAALDKHPASSAVLRNWAKMAITR